MVLKVTEKPLARAFAESAISRRMLGIKGPSLQYRECFLRGQGDSRDRSQRDLKVYPPAPGAFDPTPFCPGCFPAEKCGSETTRTEECFSVVSCIWKQ